MPSRREASGRHVLSERTCRPAASPRDGMPPVAEVIPHSAPNRYYFFPKNGMNAVSQRHDPHRTFLTSRFSHHPPAAAALPSRGAAAGPHDASVAGQSDPAAVRAKARMLRPDRVHARRRAAFARPTRRRGPARGGAGHRRDHPLRHSAGEGCRGQAMRLATKGIVAQAIRAAKAAAPDLLVITDLCFCEYTDHGHCGPLSEATGRRTWTTMPRWTCWPASGGPRPGRGRHDRAQRHDGWQVAAIRAALDAAGLTHVPS